MIFSASMQLGSAVTNAADRNMAANNIVNRMALSSLGSMPGPVRPRRRHRSSEKGSRAALPAEPLEEVGEILGVLLLVGEDLLEQPPGRRVVVTDEADHLAVAVDGDPLGHEILFDH